MVLNRRQSPGGAFVTLCLFIGIAPAETAIGQELQSIAPLLDAPEALFVPTELTVGGASVEIGATTRLEYDSNIYAQAYDEIDDLKLLFQPFINVTRPGGTVEIDAHAEGDFRKYFNHDSESAAGGEVRAGVHWTPSETDKFSLLGGWQHAIEDRGEPEGRTVVSLGPREIDIADADLRYAHQGARFGFSVRGTTARYRYSQAIDSNRDLDNYAFVGRLSYRLSPLMNGFAEGFVTKRDFVTRPLPGEFDRDSKTYGGRLGVTIDPGGKLRGEAAAGMFRLDPKDSRIKARSGVSAQVGLVYLLSPRTAFTLDAFTGDVATYQSGAQSRADTRVRIGVQQEIRHNLHAQAALVYRRSTYYGTAPSQTTYGATGEISYTLNRRMMLAVTTRYAKRTSGEPLERFERVRAGLELKIHY